MSRSRALVLVCLPIAVACVERSRGRTADEEREVRRNVGKTAPTPTHDLSASFDGKIELLGYDVSPETLRPGAPVRLTWHWKTVRGIGERGWRIFTHLHDGSGTARENLDDVGTIRRLFEPSEWKPGEYVRDEQEFDLPRDWEGAVAIFYVGIWKDDDRLPVKSGPDDGENRVPARIPTTGRDASPLPRLRVPFTREALEADGVLAESAWSRAARTGRFVNTMTGARVADETEARALWTAEALWVAFECEDRDIHSTLRDRDDALWEQDVVEVFLDPGGDGRDYYELQVSPRNVVFDSFLPRHRRNRNSWNSGVRTGVRVDGTLDDGADDRRWTAEMAVPWRDITHVPPPGSSPPRPGDRWRANLFRMDWRDGSVRGTGWSAPKRPDFHALDRFGEIEFLAETE